jgi:exopolysaccharide biosynthesis polyprenyl glycosylphosphotransferase
MSLAQRTAAKAPTAPANILRLGINLVLGRRTLLGTLVVVDLIATNLAFFLAYQLRYVYELGGEVPGESAVDFGAYIPVHAMFVALCLLGYQLRGIYSLPRGSSLTREVGAIIGSSAIAAMVVFALASMVRYPASSRLTFIYAWILAVAIGIAGRATIRVARAQLHRAGLGVERVVVVGNNRQARMVMQMLAQQAHLGYRVLGFVDDAVRNDFGRFRALGPTQNLPMLVSQLGVDRVIVSLPAAQHGDIMWVLDHCRQDGVSYSMVPDLFELRLSHVNLETVSGIPLLAFDETNIAGWNLFVKRALDVTVSAALLLVLAPLFAAVAFAIKLDSPGPVLFRQIRLGRGGMPFTCYKFRSMNERAEDEIGHLLDQNEADGPIFKIRADPRLTHVGQWLRRSSIDELPQLWNVLVGDMSLVGPRPPIPDEVERYEEWHRRRLEVVPGITGLWQVSGRSELSFDEMVMLDLYYIENWSLGLDLQILARTGPAVLAGSGAF